MNDVTEKDNQPAEGTALEPAAAAPPEPVAPPARPAPPQRPGRPDRPEFTTTAPPSVRAQLPRPRAISISWWLWVAAGLAGMLTAALAILDWDDLKADMLVEVTKEYPDKDASTLQDLAEAAVACLIGIGVLLVLACVMFAALMHGRRNWGRICALIFGVLTVLYALGVMTWAPGEIQLGLGITALLMVVAVVLMYLPGNKEWYRVLKLYRTDENTKVF